MGVSGNSIAGKSFQSFAISEELLAKVVEAVKAGEKTARSSGEIQSFEVFYRGFRMNISIGRVYVIPASVCNNKGDKRFPTALLYGCLVHTFGNGEEVGDMVEQRIGETEFDEYSQADYDTIKEKLFPEGKSLVLFAPNWWNKREYITFQYTDDIAALKNLVRHQVFSAYYNPAVSSAFDAMQTNVDTTKVDVTDITPKISYPFLTENILKQHPELNKQGAVRKRIALTAKTADAVTKEVLDPQELDVFDSLDQALSQALMPNTVSVGEAGEDGYRKPEADNEVPRVAADKAAKADDAKVDPKKAPNTGKAEKDKFEALQKKDACGAAAHEAPFTNVGPGTEAADAQESMVKAVKERVEKVDGEPPIGIAIDETGVARSSTEEAKVASADAFTPVNKKDKVHPGNLRDADVIAAIDEKKWGTATIPLNFGPRKGGVPTVKAASYIADQIALDIEDNHVASSTKTRKAAAQREATLAKNRQKQADVPMDIDSIWAEITEDMGPAPVVDVPSSSAPSSEGSSEPKSDRPADGRPRKSDVGELPKEFTSDKPEKEKAMSDSEAESQEDSTPKPESHESEEPKEASEQWHVDQKYADFVQEEMEQGPSKEALAHAQELIDADDEMIYDVAANLGQIVDNVKHMTWFVEAVASELDEPGASQDRHIVDADDASPDACNHQPHDRDSMQSVCEKCGAEIYYDAQKDSWSTKNGFEEHEAAAPAQALDTPSHIAPNENWQCQNCGHQGDLGINGNCDKCDSQAVYPAMHAASKKKADTADNPYNMQDGNGAPEDKKDAVKADTSGPDMKNTASGKQGNWLDPEGKLPPPPDYYARDYEPPQGDNTMAVCKHCGEQVLFNLSGLAEHQRKHPDKHQKNADAVQPNIAEAKSEVVSPDTVDADIQQPTESVAEAAKVSADVSGDVSEAKAELDHGAKSELADNADATKVDSVEEASKQASAGDDKPESLAFDFGAGDLADIVLTEEDGDGEPTE